MGLNFFSGTQRSSGASSFSLKSSLFLGSDPLVTGAKTLGKDLILCPKGLRGFWFNDLSDRQSATFRCSSRAFADGFWAIDERFIGIHPGDQLTELGPEILDRNDAVHLVDESADLVDGLANGLLLRSEVLKDIGLGDAFASTHSEGSSGLCAKTCGKEGSQSRLEGSAELLFVAGVRIRNRLHCNAGRFGGTTGHLRGQNSRYCLAYLGGDASGFCGPAKIRDLGRTSCGWGNAFCELTGSSGEARDTSGLTSSPGNAEGHQVHGRKNVSSNLTRYLACWSSDVFWNRSVLANSLPKSSSNLSRLFSFLWRCRQEGHDAFLLDARCAFEHSRLRLFSCDLLDGSAYRCDILRHGGTCPERSGNTHERRGHSLGLLQ